MSSKNPRELLNEFRTGLKEVMKTNREQPSAYINLLGESIKPKALDSKTKELMSVAMSVYSRCEYCILVHVTKSFEFGATKEEILEAGLHAITFGGGAALSYAVTLLKDAVEEFAPDYNQ